MDSEPALSGSTVILSGVFVAGRNGPTLFDSVFNVTYLKGPAPGTDEFNTLGYQAGPSSIRPVYPMLEDIYAYKLTDQAPGVSGAFQLAANRPQLVGFRPGLRGSEAAGTWEFMFGTAATHSFNATTGYAPGPGRGVWVRQVRLETIVDQNQPVFFQNPVRSRLYRRSTNVPGPEGPQLSFIQSGSTAWDIGLMSIQTFQVPEYGRSVSITTDKSIDSYAVQTFITGALYNALVASGVITQDVAQPDWFLGGNGFGTPYIPDSSMSRGTGSAEQIDAAAAQDLLNQTINIQTVVPGANDLTSYQNRQGYAKTTLQRWEEAVAAMTSSTVPPAPAGTTTRTDTIAVSTSSVQLMPNRPTRHFGSIYNNTSANLYVGINITPTTSSFSVKLLPQDYYELAAGVTAQVNGIWDSTGSGLAQVTEVY